MRGESRKTKPLTVADLGGETREGFQTTQLGARLDRYGKAKEGSLQFRDFVRDRAAFLQDDQLSKLANDLGNCGNWAVFRDYFTVGQTRLAGICTCKKHLVCQLCSIRRGARASRLYKERVASLLAADSALQPFLVTLTVKNGPDLRERFRHLASKLRSYHKRRKGTRQKGEVLKAHSAVWSYEFTNKGNGWHPHVHAVWLCHEEPDAHALSTEWHALTGDSFIVHVRPLDMSDPVAAFCEVFKYAVKFSDLAHVDLLHAFRTLKGKRLIDSFGDLRGLDIEPSDSDELLDDLPYIERIYRFVRGVGYVNDQIGQIAA